MKEKIIPFIKKYPMSILLAIIALNLFSIGSILNKNGKLDRSTYACAKYWSSDIKELTAEKWESIKWRIAQEIGIPKDQLHEFCGRI